MRGSPDRSCGSSGRSLAPVLALLGLVALPVHAQEWIAAPPSRPETLAAPTPGQVATSSAGPATSAPGGVLRVLDKINGTVTDLEMQSVEAQDVGQPGHLDGATAVSDRQPPRATPLSFSASAPRGERQRKSIVAG
jgi:hypothetical protein